jgi:hypothetical protein
LSHRNLLLQHSLCWKYHSTPDPFVCPETTPDAYDNLTKMPTIVFETVLSRAGLQPD